MSNYVTFRNFLFENKELIQAAFQDVRVTNQSSKSSAKLFTASGDSVCGHVSAYFESLDIPLRAKSECVAFFQNARFRCLVSDYLVDVDAHVGAKRFVLQLKVGTDYRAVHQVLEEGSLNGNNVSAVNAETVDLEASSLVSFVVSIDSGAHNNEFDVVINGAYTSYSLDDSINTRLRTQFGSMFVHHNERPDYYSVPKDNAIAEPLHKRAAVYDAPRLAGHPTIRRISKTDATRKIIINAMRNNVLFSAYSAAEHKKIADVFEKVDVAEGEIVIKQGDAGDHFFVVESGRMQLYIEDSAGKPISAPYNIDAGASFGELALLYNIPRTATVAALEPSVLWRVDRHTYRYVISNTEKESLDETMNFLKEVEVLGRKFKDTLNDNDLNLLITAVEQEEFAPGDTIIRQDQPGDCFYIIKSGTVAVCKQTKPVGCESPIVPTCAENDAGYGLGPQLATLHAGDYFGERALLHEDVRQASCVAVGSVTCLSLSRDMFIRLVGQWNEIQPDRKASEDSILSGLAGSGGHHSNNTSISAANSGDPTVNGNSDPDILIEAPGPGLDDHSFAGTPPNSSVPTMLSQFHSPARRKTQSIDNETFGSLSAFLLPSQSASAPAGPPNASSRGMLGTMGFSNLPRRNSMITLEEIRSLEDVDQCFTLGTGAFGRVRLTKHKATGKFVVLKIQSKQAILEQQMESMITNEIQLMKLISHPFVAKLFCAFQDEGAVYMAMEYLPCGDFFSFLQAFGKNNMNEEKIRFYSANVVAGLDALHVHSIAYRDLKPENLVMDHRGYVKLVDLGLAKKITSGKTWTVCGTPDYIAPEVIMNKGHDKSVDYWALGVLVYEMMDGWPPFYDENPMKVYQKICSGKFSTDKPNFSSNVMDFVQQLLQKNPSKRLGNAKGGVSDICKHKWFGAFDWKGLLRGTLTAPFVPECDMVNPKAPTVEGDVDLPMVPSTWTAEI